MTLVHESHFPITEPHWYAVGPHAPLIADRTLREEHADVSALLLLGSEIAHAEAVGDRRWASRLRRAARRNLPLRAGSHAAGLYLAELALARAALTGSEAPAVEWAVCSDAVDSLARAQARATELVLWRAIPHPVITGWLAHTAGTGRRGAGAAARALRRHLLCFGIDPTDPAAAHARPGREWLYVGVLVEAGAYLRLDPVTGLGELAAAGIALSRRETRALRRARSVEVPAVEWQARMVRVIDDWTSRIPGTVR